MKEVIVKECKSYNVEDLISKVNSGVELLGGWSRYIKPGMKVLLKVNLIGPKSSETASVTHCEFVRAMTRILKSSGCDVWIGDSSGGAIAGIAPTAKSFTASGLERVAKEEGAELKNFDREGVVKVKADNKFEENMFIAKPMFDADFVINMSKLKTHSASIYTGAVKNLFGCIPGLKKAEYHKMAPNPKDLGRIICSIHKAVKVGLNVMDGITAMDGEGPTAGGVYKAEKILISEDPLALDSVACTMLGIKASDVPVLCAAIEEKLGEYELNKIRLLGDYKEIPYLEGFKLPKNFKNNKKKNYNILPKIVDFLKARPRVNKKICKKCNVCVDSCPVGAIDRESKVIDYSKCIECLCCHEMCMFKAIELKKDNPIVGVLLKFYRGNYK